MTVCSVSHHNHFISPSTLRQKQPLWKAAAPPRYETPEKIRGASQTWEDVMRSNSFKSDNVSLMLKYTFLLLLIVGLWSYLFSRVVSCFRTSTSLHLHSGLTWLSLFEAPRVGILICWLSDSFFDWCITHWNKTQSCSESKFSCNSHTLEDEHQWICAENISRAFHNFTS